VNNNIKWGHCRDTCDMSAGFLATPWSRNSDIYSVMVVYSM